MPLIVGVFRIARADIGIYRKVQEVVPSQLEEWIFFRYLRPLCKCVVGVEDR